jgi:hypothetical protein
MGKRKKKMKYTFGTTKKADDRLGKIAGIFNPLAVEFLRKYISVEIETALDLGSAPGLVDFSPQNIKFRI